MKVKLSIYLQPNYLTSRTVIEREQKQFIQIAFAVHLSAVIPAERYRSDSELQANNPVKYIDPDGRASEAAGYSGNYSGKEKSPIQKIGDGFVNLIKEYWAWYKRWCFMDNGK